MLGVAMYTTIETLFKQGLSKSEISRMMIWSRLMRQQKMGIMIMDKVQVWPCVLAMLLVFFLIGIYRQSPLKEIYLFH